MCMQQQSSDEASPKWADLRLHSALVVIRVTALFAFCAPAAAAAECETPSYQPLPKAMSVDKLRDCVSTDLNCDYMFDLVLHTNS
ncbi:hypothetical protein GCM10027343_01670 [Noviherbaspirillum agri]